MAQNKDRWLCVKEASEEIGVSVRTLYDWRKKKIGPRAYEFGNKNTRYKQSDISSWVESCATHAA